MEGIAGGVARNRCAKKEKKKNSGVGGAVGGTICVQAVIPIPVLGSSSNR